MGACVSSPSSDDNAHGRVRVFLAGCPGALTQSVVQEIVGDSAFKKSLRMSVSRRASSLSQSMHLRSSVTSTRNSVRNSLLLRGSLRKNAEEEEKDLEHHFEVDETPFTLFRPACASPTFSATPLQKKKLQARVGKVDMVLFVVPLTWYAEEMPVDMEESKQDKPNQRKDLVNRMEFALSQFRTLCQVFANTDAGVAVILDDWEGFADEVTTPDADDVSHHFSNYPVQDEGNPAAAARYFARLFQEVYNTYSGWNNCFIHVARPYKQCSEVDCSDTSHGSKKKKNDMARFLFESANALMMSYQVRSGLMGEDSGLVSMSKPKPRQESTEICKNTDKIKRSSSKNVHWVETLALEENTVSIATTGDDSSN